MRRVPCYQARPGPLCLLVERGTKGEADQLYCQVADLLRPIGLALRAAHSGNQALDGISAEIRGMAEESLANIQRGT